MPILPGNGRSDDDRAEIVTLANIGRDDQITVLRGDTHYWAYAGNGGIFWDGLNRLGNYTRERADELAAEGFIAREEALTPSNTVFLTTSWPADVRINVRLTNGDDVIQSAETNTKKHDIDLRGGSDHVLVAGSRANINLGAGDDHAISLATKGTTFGGSGDDALVGRRPEGGTGDDLLVGYANSVLLGGAGADVFGAYGQKGDHTALIQDFDFTKDKLAAGKTKTIDVVAGESRGKAVTEVVIEDTAGTRAFQMNVNPSPFGLAKYNVVKSANEFSIDILATYDGVFYWLDEEKAIANATQNTVSINFAPKIARTRVNTEEEKTVILDALAGASDRNGDGLELIAFKIGSSGWLSATQGKTYTVLGHDVKIRKDGKVAFTPADDFDTDSSGPLAFQIRVEDDAIGRNFNDTLKLANGKIDRSPTLTAEGIIDIVVDSVPQAVGGTTQIFENRPQPIDILRNNEHFETLAIDRIEIGHSRAAGLFDRNKSSEGDELKLTRLNKVAVATDDAGNRFDALDRGETLSFSFQERYKSVDGNSYRAIETVVVRGENDAPRIATREPKRVIDVDADNARYLPSSDKLKVEFTVSMDEFDPDWFFDPEGHDIFIRPDGTNKLWSSSISSGFISGIRGLDALGEGDTAYLEDRFGKPYTIDLRGFDEKNRSDGAFAFRVALEGVNDAPTANDDKARVRADDSVVINVLANDEDPDRNDRLTITSVTLDGMTGSSVTAADGTMVAIRGNRIEVFAGDRFVPVGQGDTAPLSFSYAATDAFGETGEADVVVTVRGKNDAPIAKDDPGLGTVDQNGSLSFPLALLTDNDVDPDDGQVPVPNWITQIGAQVFDIGTSAGIPRVLSQGGSLVTDKDGIAIFAPGSDFDDLMLGESRDARFSYRIEDGDLGDSATATLSVTGLNDAPVAQDDLIVVTARSGPQSASLFARNGNGPDTDVDLNDTFSVTSLFLPSNVGQLITLPNSQAKLRVGSDGSVLIDTQSVIPLSAGESASDTLPYTITDSTGLLDDAEFTITVVANETTGTVDPPVPGNGNVPLFSNTPITVDLPIMGDPASAALTSPDEPGSGRATIDGTVFSFEPGDDFLDLGPGEGTQIGHAFSATGVDGVTVGGPDAPEDDGAIILTVNGTDGSASAPLFATMVGGLGETLLLPLDTFETPIAVAELVIDSFTLGEDRIAAASYGVTGPDQAAEVLASAEDDGSGSARIRLTGPDAESSLDDLDLVFVGIGPDDLSGADIFAL